MGQRSISAGRRRARRCPMYPPWSCCSDTSGHCGIPRSARGTTSSRTRASIASGGSADGPCPGLDLPLDSALMDHPGSPPSDLPPQNGGPPPSPYEATPPAYDAPPVRVSHARVTALVVAVLLVITGVGTALVLRASNSEQSVDKFIPDTVAAYVKISLHPSVQQQQAVQDLLSRFPSSVRGKVGSKIDDILESGLKDVGLSYKTDVKPWVGGQIALAVLPPGGSTSDAPSTVPNVIGVIPVKDASAAQKALTKIKGTTPDAPAYEVVGGIVYLGRTQGQIDSFRNAVTAGHTLADNASYKREHDRAGGDGLLFAYADLSKLGAL